MTASCGQGDAELVAGLRAGDQQCLAGIYDRYADRLYDFCAGMLRDRDEAADVVQDTFLLVNGRIGQLRDPELLRPWLYAIARSVALAHARARGRVRPTDAVIDTPDPAVGPERLAEQEALRQLVADASEGLSEGDRAMLRLHLHGLEGAELGVALGISANIVHVRLSRLRDQMERSLGALLVARLGRGDCDELTAVLGKWDGRFTPPLRKRVARHLDHCPRCGERRRAVASPWALLSSAVVLVAPPELRERVLDDVQLVAHSSPDAGSEDGADGAPDPDVAAAPGAALPTAPVHRRSPAARSVAAALVVAALAGGVSMLWGGRLVAVLQAPAVPLAPVTSGPTTPGPGPSVSVVPGSSAGAGSDAPSADLTTAAPPATGVTTGITTPSKPLPDSRTPPEPEPILILSPPPPTPSTTTDPTPPALRITGQDASPPQLGLRGCLEDRADVRVTLAAEAQATAVILSWKGADESGSMPMQSAGATWSGSLGPFGKPGSVQWSVTASNAVGSTTGPTETIVVASCTVPGSIG
ncbi:MAG: sigma-70 family RNA polymerase sigma factor [Pseudonocardiaceae bacterium]